MVQSELLWRLWSLTVEEKEGKPKTTLQSELSFRGHFNVQSELSWRLWSLAGDDREVRDGGKLVHMGSFDF